MNKKRKSTFITKPLVYFSATFLLLLGQPQWNVFAEASDTITTDKKEKVVIVFKDEIDHSSIKDVSGRIEDAFKNIPIATATIPSSQIDDLQRNPNVKTVERDIVFKTNAQTQDWGISKIKAPSSWSSGYTGKGVKISILDTGISAHEDLVISGGASMVSYTSSYTDDDGHGTSVAGIIGAKNNGIGTVGTAYDANLYAVKVLDADGNGYLSDIIAGIDWSISNGMNIINMSLGTNTYSSALEDAINRAYNKGVLIVAAAGNDGTASGTEDNVDYPARLPNAIAVGATNSSNTRPNFSSTGPDVEVAAPGDSILSTYNNNSYAYMSGTSSAAPYVAGVLALLKEANPTLSNAELRNELVRNVVDLGTQGRDRLYGYGLVQAPIAPAKDKTPTVIKNLSATMEANGKVRFQYEINERSAIWIKVHSDTPVQHVITKEWQDSGVHTVTWDANQFRSGTFNFSIEANDEAGNYSVNWGQATINLNTQITNMSAVSDSSNRITFKYDINKDSKVWIKIHEPAGIQKVIYGVQQTAGTQNVVWDANGFKSGTFNYSIETNDSMGRYNVKWGTVNIALTPTISNPVSTTDANNNIIFQYQLNKPALVWVKIHSYNGVQMIAQGISQGSGIQRVNWSEKTVQPGQYAFSVEVNDGVGNYAVNWGTVIVNSIGTVTTTSPEYYSVRSGDTLYSVSRKFGVSVTWLKNRNNLSSNYLYVGQRLIVH